MKFKYNNDKNSNFKYLVKSRLKSSYILLVAFTIFYFIMESKLFFYNFPMNTKYILITWFIFICVLFVIMLLFNLLFSYLNILIFNKSNYYGVFDYELKNNKLKCNDLDYEIDLNNCKIKFKKNYIYIYSNTLKQIFIFEEKYFIDEKYNDLVKNLRGIK